MDELETKKILAILKGAYPNFYKDMKRDAADAIVALWSEMFSEDDYAIVAVAVKILIKTRKEGWPPNVGEVSEYIAKLTQPEEMSEMEAWLLVKKAIGDYRFYDNPENSSFFKLPPLLQRIVGSSRQLHDWGQLSEDELNTVVASNFMRSYRAKAKHQHEIDMLPESIKTMIGQSEGLKRIGG